MGLFMNTAIDTFTMSSISSSSSKIITSDPTLTTLNFSPQSNFMFALDIIGVNITDPTQRHFDFELSLMKFYRGTYVDSTHILPMENCTRAHFAINNKILSEFDNLPTYRWLCPPINYTLDITGKYSS